MHPTRISVMSKSSENESNPVRLSPLRRWEALRPGQQLRRSYVASFVVLLVFHIALSLMYHRITIPRAIGYAFFESMFVAGFVTLATQGELARRRDHETVTVLKDPELDSSYDPDIQP